MELYKKMLVSGNGDGEGIYSFKFEIDVSKGSGGTLNNFTLPITTVSYVNPIYVDWGDGSIEEMIDNISRPSHQYANGNIRVVKIRNTTGKMPNFSFGSISVDAYNRSNLMLTKVLTPLPKLFNSVGVVSTSLQGLFHNCTYLTSIPNDLFKYNTNVTYFYNCFQNCSSLTTIPNDLFKYNVNVAAFQSCFYGCSSLTTIPNDLFRYNVSVNDFISCFYGCSSLTTIPNDLFRYNVSVNDFISCFRSCSSLTTIPNDLFRYNVLVNNFTYCFTECSSLTTIPNDLFRYNVSVTSFQYCFQSCTGLNFTLVSANIFPSSFNASSVDIRQMFYISSANTSMKGNAQDFVNFWSPKSTLFTASLRNRTGMTNYSTIPSTWK